MSSDQPSTAPTHGEPAAGTVPGDDQPDDATDTVQMDPGSAGDTADVDIEGQPAVTPADPAVAESVND